MVEVLQNLARNMRRFIIMPSLACLLLLGILSGVRAQEAQPGKNEEDNGYSQISIFAKAIELIRQDYVDGNKTSYHDLITAAMTGMLSGDQILRINGVSTERMDLQDAINVLRGPAGRKVTLTLLRPSTKEIKDYALERAEIKVQSVKGAKLLDAELTGPFKIGYIRLIQFNEPTAEELSKALDELQKQGMQALILDLRNNPGGLLNSAV